MTPNAPLNVVAVAGDTEVTLSWVEATWNGGVFDISVTRFSRALTMVLRGLLLWLILIRLRVFIG